ncbi:hypothetical protein DL771_009997 [Monosporascus sp. 5C6A]|nr:hypothetical protein DL771_009997 [Monosporascus sp. 5C6A]
MAAGEKGGRPDWGKIGAWRRHRRGDPAADAEAGRAIPLGDVEAAKYDAVAAVTNSMTRNVGEPPSTLIADAFTAYQGALDGPRQRVVSKSAEEEGKKDKGKGKAKAVEEEQ